MNEELEINIVKTFLNALCGHLGTSWRISERKTEDGRDFDIHDHGGTITHVSGARLFIRGNDYKFSISTRIEVHGGSPQDAYGAMRTFRDWGLTKEAHPSITLSIAKPIDKVAKDIETRLLATYLPLYKEALEKLAIDVLIRKQREEGLNALAEIVGNETGKSRLDEVSFYLGDTYGNIQSNYGGSYDLRIRSLSQSQAEALLKTLVIVNELEGNKQAEAQ